MKLKLIKLLAWTGLLGLFAAGTSACTFKSETVGKYAPPESPVLLDGDIACPPQDDEEEEEQELAPVPAEESETDSKQ